MHAEASALRATQVLGRNLEALVGRAQELKANMKDEFVSVEHLLAAFVDDARFGQGLLEGAGLTRSKLEAAIKEVSDARLPLRTVHLRNWHSDAPLPASMLSTE